ncbi:MAG TPA: tetratricopeptide repeat protein [Stellaceae bacterium]
MAPSPTLLAEAVALHRADRLREAEPLYAAVLAAEPDHPDALHFLGVLKHRQGASEEAVALIRRALALAPSPDLHNNLGNVLLQSGEPEAAAAAYRRVVELRPDDAAAHHNLGIALQAMDQPAEAEAALERAIELEPRQALFHYSAAMLWLRRGVPEMALPLLQVALALDPKFSQAHLARIRAIRRMGNQPGVALKAVTEWLTLEPDNPMAQHFRAVFSGEVPPRASDAFVRHIFDKYAASFDTHLGRLAYRAPQLLQAAIAPVIGEPRAALDILDAGCGTGLCGPLLRPFARRLVGVDLAEAMLTKARERDLYDELSAGELTAFIAAQPHSYDVIVSADTLVYFGDLAAVTHAAAGALRAGGVFAFSLERSAQATDLGYRLEDHGRFSHHPDYVRRILTDAGLAVTSMEAATPRNEGGVPVDGLVVVARKPSG